MFLLRLKLLILNLVFLIVEVFEGVVQRERFVFGCLICLIRKLLDLVYGVAAETQVVCVYPFRALLVNNFLRAFILIWTRRCWILPLFLWLLLKGL